jgi:hypothetical protein
VRCSPCSSACPRYASAEQLRPHASNSRCHAAVPRLRRTDVGGERRTGGQV